MENTPLNPKDDKPPPYSVATAPQGNIKRFGCYLDFIFSSFTLFFGLADNHSVVL